MKKMLYPSEIDAQYLDRVVHVMLRHEPGRTVQGSVTGRLIKISQVHELELGAVDASNAYTKTVLYVAGLGEVHPSPEDQVRLLEDD